MRYTVRVTKYGNWEVVFVFDGEQEVAAGPFGSILIAGHYACMLNRAAEEEA